MPQMSKDGLHKPGHHPHICAQKYWPLSLTLSQTSQQSTCLELSPVTDSWMGLLGMFVPEKVQGMATQSLPTLDKHKEGEGPRFSGKRLVSPNEAIKENSCHKVLAPFSNICQFETCLPGCPGIGSTTSKTLEKVPFLVQTFSVALETPAAVQNFSNLWSAVFHLQHRVTRILPLRVVLRMKEVISRVPVSPI